MKTSTLEEIYRHADETYPREACGLVFDDGTVHRARNIQDELHALDPATYVRTGYDAYTLDLETNRILERSFRSHEPVIAIYHSHPDVGAYFSDEDVKKALYQGVPIHPVDHLVVDTRKGRSIGGKRFRFTGELYELHETYSRTMSSCKRVKEQS